MTEYLELIHVLVQKAAHTDKADDALKFSQAASNVGHALQSRDDVLELMERRSRDGGPAK